MRMAEFHWYAIAILLAGAAIGYLLGRLKSAGVLAELSAARSRADEVGRQRELVDGERRDLLEQVRNISTQLASEQQKAAGLEESRAAMKAELENLAQAILEDKSRRFTEQNRMQLEQLLGPLSERLKEFREQVQKAYGSENEARAALRAEVLHLSDLNKTVSREAANLTQALKGQAKTRGNWGEVILESVLEKAGLMRGQHFHTQVSTTTSGGRRQQPDVILDLPDGRNVVIDSKVSLVAYERQCAAQGDDERAAAAREHAESLRRHIEQLASKDYAALPGLKSPDFVFLFVPIEPALYAALETAPELIESALEHNIVLVTAPSVIAATRLIAHLWQQDSQNRHARQIAEQGGQLYDKFAKFCQDLEQIGMRLRQAQEDYDSAMNKLRDGRGSLLRRTEQLRKLGARVTAKTPALMKDAPEDEEEKMEDQDAGAS